MQSTLHRTGLAIDLMINLTARGNENPVTVRQLSEGGLSVSYIEQIIRKMRIGGLVTSIRGPGGGYFSTFENTTVGDVIRAMQPGGFLGMEPVLDALDKIEISVLSTISDGGC